MCTSVTATGILMPRAGKTVWARVWDPLVEG